MTEVVAREVAETQFDKFCDDMDIDRNVDKMKEEDAEAFNENKEILIDAMMAGRLVLNDNSEPVYTPKRERIANPLTFREPTGADLMAMDRKKAGEQMGKMFALMDSMTKSVPGTCAKLSGPDLKVAKAVTILFTA